MPRILIGITVFAAMALSADISYNDSIREWQQKRLDERHRERQLYDGGSQATAVVGREFPRSCCPRDVPRTVVLLTSVNLGRAVTVGYNDLAVAGASARSSPKPRSRSPLSKTHAACRLANWAGCLR